jgi:hypothetical protein
MNKLILYIFLAASTFVVASCANYFIPLQSFKQQFKGIDSTSYKEVLVGGPIGERYRYYANPIKKIKCEDTAGNSYELQNSPSIEIRFTHGADNQRTIFYFDRVYVSDCCVTGVESRFIESIRTSIHLKDITKIEIQDGGKNFNYLTRSAVNP